MLEIAPARSGDESDGNSGKNKSARFRDGANSRDGVNFNVGLMRRPPRIQAESAGSADASVGVETGNRCIPISGIVVLIGPHERRWTTAQTEVQKVPGTCNCRWIVPGVL